MAETPPPPSGPLAGASKRELRELQQFLLYLGSALTAAGEAVNQVEEHLRRVAAAYGAPRARVSVLPTYLVVALEPGAPGDAGADPPAPRRAPPRPDGGAVRGAEGS
jgi:Putative threonine/serine exporter